MSQELTQPGSPAQTSVTPVPAADSVSELLHHLYDVRRARSEDSVRLLQELTPHLHAARRSSTNSIAISRAASTSSATSATTNSASRGSSPTSSIRPANTVRAQPFWKRCWSFWGLLLRGVIQAGPAAMLLAGAPQRRLGRGVSVGFGPPPPARSGSCRSAGSRRAGASTCHGGHSGRRRDVLPRVREQAACRRPTGAMQGLPEVSREAVRRTLPPGLSATALPVARQVQPVAGGSRALEEPLPRTALCCGRCATRRRRFLRRG